MLTFLSKIPTAFKSFNRFPSNPFLQLSIHTVSAPEIYANNLKIRALVHGGKINSARQLFDRMPDRDIVTWNTMVAAYWQYNYNDMNESKRLFDSMPERNVVSWNSMIAGYLENGELDEAFKYFYNMPSRNIASWNAMISGLVKCDWVDEAERLFDEMPKRNVISYTAMVDGFSRKGEIDRARSLFDRIPVKNSVSWAVMISGYVENRKFDEARELFDQMPEKNVVAFTAMITGHCKEGKVEDARNLFEQIQYKDLVSWNAMIAGYAHNGHGEEALKLHSKMLELDIISRAGQLEKAFEIITAMPFEADGSVWGSLLGACRVHMNVELAEVAARKLVELDSQNSGAYVMLSNIYAAADMWPEVTKVRGLMKERGVQKQPGFSWMEIGEKTHLFMGGDVSHPDISRIYSEVERIDLHMKISNVTTAEKLL